MHNYSFNKSIYHQLTSLSFTIGLSLKIYQLVTRHFPCGDNEWSFNFWEWCSTVALYFQIKPALNGMYKNPVFCCFKRESGRMSSKLTLCCKSETTWHVTGREPNIYDVTVPLCYDGSVCPSVSSVSVLTLTQTCIFTHIVCVYGTSFWPAQRTYCLFCHWGLLYLRGSVP